MYKNLKLRRSRQRSYEDNFVMSAICTRLPLILVMFTALPEQISVTIICFVAVQSINYNEIFLSLIVTVVTAEWEGNVFTGIYLSTGSRG